MSTSERGDRLETRIERGSLNILNTRIFRGWYVVAACAAIGAYGGGVYFYGFTLFFNPLREELALSATQASWVFSLTRLEGAFEGVLIGFMIDRWGARKIMLVGIPVVGVGYLLWATVVDSYISLLVVYVGIIALGVNGGFFHPGLAVANNWFIRKRAKAMAVISAGVGIGGAIIVPAVGMGIDNLTGWPFDVGWRNVAFIAGIILLVCIWPLVLVIRHRPESVGLRPDGDPVPEEVSNGSSGSSEDPSGQKVTPLVGEVEYGVGEAFRTKAMWILLAGISLRFTAHTAIMVHLSPILESQGMSTTLAGFAIGIMVALSIPGRILVGFLGDRFQKNRVVAWLMIIQVVATFVLYGADTRFELWLFIVLFAFAYGAGILNWAIVGDYFGRARFATLRGMMGLVFSGGAVVGPVLLGYLFDNGFVATVFGKEWIFPEGEYTLGIFILLIVTIMATVCFWFAGPPKHKPDVLVKAEI